MQLKDGSQLLDAIEIGNIPQLNAYFNETNINKLIYKSNRLYGINPLIHAIRTKKPVMVSWLLSKGADINEEDEKGHSAFINALIIHHPAITKILQQNGLMFYSRCHRHAFLGNIQELEDLFNQDPSLLKIEDTYGNNLLIYAATQSLATVKYLYEKGISISQRNKGGDTPLLYAASYGQREIVEFLVEKGANLSEKNNMETTPLLSAAANGHVEIVTLLLEKGANLGEKNKDGDISILLAARYGHTKLVNLFLEKGANVSEKNDMEITPLLSAAANGHVEIVTLLLEKGANLSEKKKDGESSILLAARYGHTKLVNLLLEKGANVSERNNEEWTPLLYAAANGHIEIVTLLLEKGATLNEIDTGGNTPLLLAAANGQNETINLLLEEGANLSDKNETGNTPLSYAAMFGHLETIKLLLRKGAAIMASIPWELPTDNNLMAGQVVIGLKISRELVTRQTPGYHDAITTLEELAAKMKENSSKENTYSFNELKAHSLALLKDSNISDKKLVKSINAQLYHLPLDSLVNHCLHFLNEDRSIGYRQSALALDSDMPDHLKGCLNPDFEAEEEKILQIKP